MELGRNNVDVARQLFTTALALATALGEVDAETVYSGSIAQIERIKGQYQLAYDHYCKALDVFSARRWIDAQGAVWSELGELHRLEKQLHEALQCELRALEFHTRSGSTTGLAADWLNVGRTHFDGSNMFIANACATEAYLLFEQRQNSRGMKQAIELLTLIHGKPPSRVWRSSLHADALRRAMTTSYPPSQKPLARTH